MRKFFLKIYGAYWYVIGYLHGTYLGTKYGCKASAIYRKAKNKGGFDEESRADMMKLAREYQAEDPFHENAYDIIREFDELASKAKLGVHYF